MKEESAVKRFCISYPIHRPLCIVEAEDEAEAISRAALVIAEARQLQVIYDCDPQLLIEELHDRQPSVLPSYPDFFFQLIELRDAQAH